MDEDLYDEFGNYIGPEERLEHMLNQYSDESDEEMVEERNDQVAWREEWKSYSVTLYEDKKYFPDAEDVY